MRLLNNRRRLSSDSVAFGGVVFGVAVLQFLLCAYTFPLSELLSTRELLNIDHAYHLYQISLALELTNQGRSIGYDPSFAAGYLGGIAFDPSARFPALLASALQQWLSPVQSYKLYVFTASILGPVCVPLAARVLNLSNRVAMTATGLGLCLWWASAFRWYHTAGMVSFVLGSYLALPYFALVTRAIKADKGSWLVIGLGISGAVFVCLHPLFPIPVAVLTLCYLALSRDIAFKSATLRISTICVLSVVPNVPGLIASFGYTGTTEALTQPYQRRVSATMIVLELIGVWGSTAMGSKLYPLLAVCAIASLFPLRQESSRRLCLTFFASWVLLVVFSALGAAIPVLGSLQPNRFSAPAYLFLVIPAALGVRRLFEWARRRTRLARYFARFALVALALVAGVAINEVRREVSHDNVGHYGVIPPEVRGLAQTGERTLAWLKENTSPAGRVLFEQSLGRVHDGAHLAGYLASQSRREFIGGPYPYFFFASAWDGWAFGAPIAAIPHDRFRDYLRLYNIGWIVVHSRETIEYLGAVAGVRPVEKIGQLQAYKVDQDLTYFLEGSGTIDAASSNWIVVTIDKPGNDGVTLKYHYVPGLRASDGSELRPVFLMDDPRPFINIKPRSTVFELGLE